MARTPHVTHTRNPGIQRARSLLQVISAEPDIRIRKAKLAARAAGQFGTTYRGMSVLGDKARHGGFVSVASGGTLKRATPATPAEAAAWKRKAFRNKLIVLSRAEKVKLGLNVPKKKPVSAAQVAARRSRSVVGPAQTAAYLDRVRSTPKF